MTPAPTSAQRVALEAIQDGLVVRVRPYRPGRREVPATFKSYGAARPPRADTIARCVEMKWARVAHAASASFYARAPVELTDAGREALAWRS